jgi:predicted nucleic acid-binding protein
MKKNSTVFIDTSAWIAILNKDDRHYDEAREYFTNLLGSSARPVTNNIVIDEVLQELKKSRDGQLAKSFLSILDESVLSVNLRVDWISRRIRRIALDNFFKTKNENLKLRHFYINESVKRKKADLIFSFDEILKFFDFPVMPQTKQD